VTSGVPQPPGQSICPRPDAEITPPPVVELDEPLIDLRTVQPIRLDLRLADTFASVRIGVADRLVTAQTLIPRGLRLLIIAGYLPPPPHTAPLAYEPHFTGGAVDLTLCTDNGVELDLGTAVNPTPNGHETSHNTPTTIISAEANRNRRILRDALTTTGFVNHPTLWWHWSYGDRYWAHITQTPTAPYGPTTSPTTT
jgi:D-alanyl-D-alanine dipeptidase